MSVPLSPLLPAFHGRYWRIVHFIPLVVALFMVIAFFWRTVTAQLCMLFNCNERFYKTVRASRVVIRKVLIISMYRLHTLLFNVNT
jgi:hypothetical protein